MGICGAEDLSWFFADSLSVLTGRVDDDFFDEVAHVECEFEYLK